MSSGLRRGGRRPGPAPPGEAARALAIDALVRIEAGGYSNLVLPGLLRSSGLDERDRAFVTELVYDTLRAQGPADFLLAGSSRRPLAELDPPVRAALRLAATQRLGGVAPYAADGPAVGALGRA
ncbi:MAG TPA: transcription antitermination factor NusB, partial [Acidimicrobiia bacterium]|nr:transcription antitermination factor NusB [Acidimicrobiia bacterium]